jgi:cyclin G-associated kinase
MFAADKTANKAILEEINFLKQLSNHPNVLKFIAAACEDGNSNINNNSPRNEYLVLTELCKGGSLIDFIRSTELNTEQVLQVIYQVSKAVQFIHSQNPAIIHRDIKVCL